jgi:hypothetical protein
LALTWGPGPSRSSWQTHSIRTGNCVFRL